MKTWSNRFAILVALAMALLAVGCSGDDSDYNGDTDGKDDGDDDDADDDSSNDDLSDDDSELPACPPYSFDRWFAIAEDYNLYEGIDNFRGLSRPSPLAECVMHFGEAEAAWTVDCGEWIMWGNWLDEERLFPLADGQEILFFFRMYDDEIGLYAIWVFDTDENLIMFEVNSTLNPYAIYGDTFDETGENIPHYSDPANNVCRYSEDESLPPLYDPSDDWLAVYGRDSGGQVLGSAFYIPGPGESSLSDDGKLEVLNVHNFGGDAWSEDSGIDMPGPHEYFSVRTYIQAVAAE